MTQFALTVRLCTALAAEWGSDGSTPPVGCEYSDGFGVTRFQAKDMEDAKSKVFDMIGRNDHIIDGEQHPLIPKDVITLVAQLWGQTATGTAYAYTEALNVDSGSGNVTIVCYSEVEAFVTAQIKRFAQKIVNELSQKMFVTA